jgi:hypothetical protein
VSRPNDARLWALMLTPLRAAGISADAERVARQLRPRRRGPTQHPVTVRVQLTPQRPDQAPEGVLIPTPSRNQQLLFRLH